MARGGSLWHRLARARSSLLEVACDTVVSYSLTDLLTDLLTYHLGGRLGTGYGGRPGTDRQGVDQRRSHARDVPTHRLTYSPGAVSLTYLLTGLLTYLGRAGLTYWPTDFDNLPRAGRSQPTRAAVRLGSVRMLRPGRDRPGSRSSGRR
eukprot:scaffold118795_cov48-Phaeocystis_antarctica.AAC.1